MTLRTLDAVVRELRQRVASAGTQRTLAKQLKVSQQHLSDVLARRRAPGPKMLRALGYEKRIHVVQHGAP